MNKAQRLRNAIMGYKTGEAPTPPPAGDYIPTKGTILTGTQWVDLGLKGNEKTAIDIVFVAGGKGRVFGSSYYSNKLSIYVTPSEFENGWNSTGMGNQRGANLRQGYSTDGYNHFNINYDRVILNEVFREYDDNYLEFETNTNMFLGATSYLASTSGTFQGEIASFKYYEDGVLLFDMQPCIYNDVAGFWNKVTNTFHGSSTDTPFIAGEIL